MAKNTWVQCALSDGQLKSALSQSQDSDTAATLGISTLGSLAGAGLYARQVVMGSLQYGALGPVTGPVQWRWAGTRS